MRDALNLAGAITTVAYYVSCVAVFVSRLAGRPGIDRALGVGQIAAAVPLVVLLVLAPRLDRPVLYYVQVSLMLLFIAVEAVVDTILRVEFRSVRAAVIPYVVLFFAGTGGMLGVAALAGRAWTLTAAGLFLVMAVLAFVQRRVTGI
jgi:hypothetical protein